MPEVRLAGGRVAVVDDADYERISRYKWRACKPRNVVYAMTNVTATSTEYMHHMVLGVRGVDHRDGNGLNNQRSNLRPCNQSQNGANTRPRSGGTSRYKGVSWHKLTGTWRAYIRVNYRQIQLGHFETEEEAARAYDAAALEHFGAFANLNFAEVA